MHPNPIFRNRPDQLNLSFAKARGFGTLVVSTAGAPLISHVPFVLDEIARTVGMHLVRSNPIARLVKESTPATVAVVGPHSYISPDWYETPDQVPTWNYVAVHLTGMLEPLPPKDLRPHLEELSHQFEEQLAPKPEWLLDKMGEEPLAKMIRQILPFRLRIADVDGTWKLNQNKTDEVRLRAGTAVAEHGIGNALSELAALMAEPPEKQA
ncbi:FMN-binding negative transcriptional regulator [Actibacterium pelagium]|uniref:Transcriptional regulator n=1 Tax=Actibacterium pelagium TaxID=2029103 RepID=A0A917EK56_9RHOB|nr:FMN-binding negative transcriptional regulator [Actibacterium pelagium]GGE51948.1 transcriptional regulator [Actibacterium pelagium]